MNYTHRPTEGFCTEITKEIYEALLPWIKENGIPVNPIDGTNGFKNNCSYTHFHWTENKQLSLFWDCEDTPNIPLSSFIAKFKTPTETETDAKKRERLIDELYNVIGATCSLSVTLDTLVSLRHRVKEIQSLKPKA